MQYANINDAQAAMTSDQYVGLNADGTYGLFDRAQNPHVFCDIPSFTE